MKVSKHGKSVTLSIGDRVIVIREEEALDLLKELIKVFK
jgi:hypothetical protein